MKILSLACLTALIFLLAAGCTHAPVNKAYSPSFQFKANAAEHWRRMAAQLCDELAKNQPGIAEKTVYLDCPGRDASDFGLAYDKLVKLEMLKRSWKVSEFSDSAQLRVTCESHLIVHGQRDFLMFPNSIPGTVGYFVVWFFTGAGGAWEFTSRYDLMVTCFVHETGQLTGGGLQIVYVPEGDEPLYGEVQAHAPGDAGTWAAVEARARAAVNK